jgi:hypothetical protein
MSTTVDVGNQLLEKPYVGGEHGIRLLEDGVAKEMMNDGQNWDLGERRQQERNLAEVLNV